MQTLEIGTTATFTFLCQTRKGEQSEVGYLWKDESTGDIFILKAPVGIQEVYTAEDRAELTRMEAMAPIRSGDTVLVDGARYAVTIHGNFADAGMLAPL